MATSSSTTPFNKTKHRELSWRNLIFYSFGHILNDLTAGTWFTYLLIYMKNIVKFSSASAGTLLLLGQLFDAVFTPVVAMEMDNTRQMKYGSKKHWHLAGSILLAIAFPFVFNLCINCENSDHWAMFFYYVPFIFLLQLGWGCAQIAHLSLIPEIADSVHDKCDLNAGRYAATVTSNIFVFVITWIMLSSGKEEEANPNQLSKSDAKAFTYVVLIVVGVGLFFVTLFHLGVKEQPRDCSHEFATKSSKRSASNWAMWFRVPLFYQTAIMYMCVRLIVNITQVYIPMYTLETLHLTKDKIAIMPLIIYVSGFASTFLSKPLNKYIGRQGVFLVGSLVIFVVCTWMWFLPPRSGQIYGASVLIGIGGSTLLVTALTMLADLIGENVETGAFVYGAMSFMDKMSNGVVVQIIQAFYPQNSPSNPNAGGQYYRSIMVFVAGTAALIAVITLFTTYKTRKNTQGGRAVINESDERRCLLAGANGRPSRSSSITHDYSWSLVCIKGPLTPYEPAMPYIENEEVTSSMQLTGSTRERYGSSPNSYSPVV